MNHDQSNDQSDQITQTDDLSLNSGVESQGGEAICSDEPPDIYDFNLSIKRRFRFARWLLILTFTILLGGGLMISSLKAEHGMVIYSDGLTEWVSGRQVSLRLISFELFLNRPLKVSKSTLTLTDDQGDVKLKKELSRALEDLRQVTITSPQEPGVYRVRVEVEALDPHTPHRSHDEPIYLVGETSVSVRAPHEIKPYNPQLELASTPTIARARRGSGSLKIFAADQQVTMELPSSVFVIAQDEQDRPWRGEVSVRLMEGRSLIDIPRQVSTDERGIAELQIAPQALRVSLLSSADVAKSIAGELQEATSVLDAELETSTEEYLEPQPHHFNLIPKRRIVHSDELVELEVISSQDSPRLYLDVWWGDRWLTTEMISLSRLSGSMRAQMGKGALYRGRAQVRIPQLPLAAQESPQLLWVQAYEQPYQIDEVRGGAYLIWTQSGFTSSSLAVWLRAKIKQLHLKPHGYWDHIDDKALISPRLMRLALGRIKRPTTNMLPLINTAQSLKQSTAALRDRYVQTYLKLTKSLALTLMIWMGIVMIRQYRHQARQEGWSDPESLSQLRAMTIRWIVYLTIVIATFFGLLTFIPSLV